MDEFTATEQAYKNGYEQGQRDAVKHGRWDECDWVEYDGHSECIHYPKEALRCSNCCNAFKKKLLWKRNYCPNCGAKMDLEENE